jgi:NAD(P)-dependent dehydrogenase (short-subunit alcohol dehydrogenase family)
MLSLNLYSGYVLSRSFVPAMLKQGRGAIVNVASRAAIDHAASAAAYAASKAAAVAMVDSFAADLKGTGIRANSILPRPKSRCPKWLETLRRGNDNGTVGVGHRACKAGVRLVPMKGMALRNAISSTSECAAIYSRWARAHEHLTSHKQT